MEPFRLKLIGAVLLSFSKWVVEPFFFVAITTSVDFIRYVFFMLWLFLFSGHLMLGKLMSFFKFSKSQRQFWES